MIKRRFYRHEHGDRNGPSDSSSSSDSEVEAESTEDTEEEEEEDMVVGVKEKNQPCSSSSGYESEDSSAQEVDLDSSGLPTNDDDMGAEKYRQDVGETHLYDADIGNTYSTESGKDAIPSDVPNCVLKSKSVFKCKLCPRIVCLTEETLKAHLKSKRHARSEKLFSDGRLKLMLNSDGEIEGETHQERHASTLASAQSNKNSSTSGKKNKGRQRQRKRLKKKAEGLPSTKTSAKSPAKKRRKSND